MTSCVDRVAAVGVLAVRIELSRTMMTARSVVAHHHRLSARMRHVLRRREFHDGGHLGFRVCRIPMLVIGYMAVAIVTTLGVPIFLIAIVIARVSAIDGRFGEPTRPYLSDTVRRLDP